MRLCRNREDADDLVQETLTKALAKQTTIPDDHVGPWLMVVLYRIFLDGCRRRRAESKAVENIRHLTPRSTPAHTEPPPKWTLVTDEAHREAVAELPDHLRQPYLLRAKGMSYRGIADRLNLSTNTVGTQIRRARETLRGLLGSETE